MYSQYLNTTANQWMHKVAVIQYIQYIKHYNHIEFAQCLDLSTQELSKLYSLELDINEEILDELLTKIGVNYLEDTEFNKYANSLLFKYFTLFNYSQSMDESNRIIKEIEDRLEQFLYSEHLISTLFVLSIHYANLGNTNQSIYYYKALSNMHMYFIDSQLETYRLLEIMNYELDLPIQVVKNRFEELKNETTNEEIAVMMKYYMADYFTKRRLKVDAILHALEAKEIFLSKGNFQRSLQCLYISAVNYERMGKYKTAAETYINLLESSQQLEEHSIYNDSFYNLFRLYLRLNKYEEAYKLYLGLSKSSTLLQTQRFILQLCYILVKIGRIEEGMVYFELLDPQKAINSEFFDLIYTYIKNLIEGETSQEKILYSILDYCVEYQMQEVYEVYAYQLIEILTQKRKYKEICDIQEQLINFLN